jgi:phage pi2 protein 07
VKLKTSILGLFLVLTLFNISICESHHSPDVGSAPNWQWVKSTDTDNIYVDMNKKNFHRIDKNTFSYWMAMDNITNQTISFSHITADMLNKNYRMDRIIDFKEGAISFDTSEFDDWPFEWKSYHVTYEEDTINYVLNHLKELEDKK